MSLIEKIPSSFSVEQSLAPTFLECTLFLLGNYTSYVSFLTCFSSCSSSIRTTTEVFEISRRRISRIKRGLDRKSLGSRSRIMDNICVKKDLEERKEKIYLSFRKSSIENCWERSKVDEKINVETMETIEYRWRIGLVNKGLRAGATR